MSEFRMGSRMCNYCRRNLPSPDLCGCEGEKRARVKSMEAEIAEARTDWSLSDGTIPNFRCSKCHRATPMLVHGLGFDCCALPSHQ